MLTFVTIYIYIHIFTYSKQSGSIVLRLVSIRLKDANNNSYAINCIMALINIKCTLVQILKQATTISIKVLIITTKVIQQQLL